ncbi:alpha/beta fold hydrolase [Anaerofustis stercorihominis]|uniref:alpha/beta fold hydrolase n=1 Tax=Anaerofustis stercorihominis TaxID=214853 RepID=UPI00214CF5E0|nr:alpha/beta hydrolase [Anaerofustis stercorihominis]MCR2033560.1 alpha/beta hydrolase [Anaerofustis stercorihominis]
MSYFKYKNKNVYYREIGEGKPVMFLHGNAVSSKMFKPILSLYKNNFKVILIDFLGSGKSDRVETFDTDLWIDQGKQVIKLIKYLGYDKVNLIGTSGGAWAAINAALYCPELINKVVADSFDGRKLGDTFKEDLIEERISTKKSIFTKYFYKWCHGKDWENPVDKDTEVLIKMAEEDVPLFYRPIKELSVPLLLTGSMKDEMIKKDFITEYEEMIFEIGAGDIHIFEKGKHPAIISNAKEASKIIIDFLE